MYTSEKDVTALSNGRYARRKSIARRTYTTYGIGRLYMILSKFGSAEFPLRASSLVKLAQCGLQLTMIDGHSNEPAETGSLVHLGIKAYHTLQKDKNAALAVMASSGKKFPLANPTKAKTHFTKYCDKEHQWGNVIECEREIRFTLPAIEGPEIVVIGTLDQIRDSDGLTVIDVKTGSKPASEMMQLYGPQLAAYQIGASLLYPEKAIRAAILRTLDLVTGGRVLYPMPWTLGQCWDILAFVAHDVAQVRRGLRVPRAGKHCDYCPAQNIGNCIAGRVPVDILPEMSLDTLGDL